MSRLLADYLAEVDLGLRGLSPGRRRLILRELENHLLDEAEARGLEDEAGMAELLREKDPPEALARDISTSEGVEASHHSGASLAAGGILGLATGVLLVLQGFPWYLGISFGVVHGLAVGTGLFWLRPRWQRLNVAGRLAVAILMGTLLAIPLGFTKYFTSQTFIWSRLFYGAFTGYLVERHGRPRPVWHVVAETALFTAFMFVLEFWILHRLRRFSLRMIEIELVFNLVIAGSVLGALWLKRQLSGRLVLGSGNDR